MILPAGMLLAILGSLALGPRVQGASLGCNLCFWAFFLAFLRRRGTFGRGFPPFLFFLPLFYLLSFFHRETTERMDYLFGSDMARYLKDALSFTTGPRHIGVSILTFPFKDLERLGEALGVPRLGHEYLYLQSALIGWIAVVLFHRALGAVAAAGLRRIAFLLTCVFAFSLAILAFSSLFETFLASLMFLLLFLESAGRYARTGGVFEGAILALLTLLALSMSLENVYLAPVFVVTAVLRATRRGGTGILREAAVYAATLLVGFCLLVITARGSMGPAFYPTWEDKLFPSASANLATHMDHFLVFHSDFSRLLDPRAYLAGIYRFFVMSILAQPWRPVTAYMWDLKNLRPLAPANLAYECLLLVLLVVSGRGLIQRLKDGDFETLFRVATLGSILVIRQTMVTFYAWRGCILFAPPSIMALWLLVGAGLLGKANQSGWSVRVAEIALLLMALLLLGVNGAYLLASQRAALPG
ncbi:MAG TPA: hypothetical protein VGR67_07870 [Candidatus Polarisedimenticolia bacterium]|nr:hypothetical protein [Candidatus Polarisedimenticolia bacterium]